MKHHILLFACVISIFAGCAEKESTAPSDSLPSNMTAEEESLISAAKTAFRENRPELINDRIFEGMDERSRKYIENNIRDTVEKGYTSLVLKRIDPPLRGGNLSNGSEYVWYVPVEWELVVKHPQRVPNVNEQTAFQLGTAEGKLVISSKIQKSLLEGHSK